MDVVFLLLIAAMIVMNKAVGLFILITAAWLDGEKSILVLESFLHLSQLFLVLLEWSRYSTSIISMRRIVEFPFITQNKTLNVSFWFSPYQAA